MNSCTITHGTSHKSGPLIMKLTQEKD
uniref:Uncharacterized protein n=1 Tax=Rhizophora mucronata TaxID=61149 RepID=A0A2P2IHB8_RHIMU